MSLDPVWWAGDGVGYIDQRRLPAALEQRTARSTAEVVEAIATLAVRGAPAIGIFGAYGVALTAQTLSPEDFAAAAARIRAARPTAVNLAWAVDRVLAAAPHYLREAEAIHAAQRASDRLIAQAALELFPPRGGVATHCNTGPLATGGDGTALGCIIAAHRAGRDVHVYVDETRPLLQGARLTAYELREAGVPATLIVDGAAALAMRAKGIALAIVGADRIARNGDAANKIGTYALAIAAKYHGIPFYVAAPCSTIDLRLASGTEIPIEERGPEEIRAFLAASAAPPEFPAYNPAFDVTPADLIAGIVTEAGIARAPYEESLPRHVRGAALSQVTSP
jgi:methylthioribose-1-phosphate isomerase